MGVKHEAEAASKWEGTYPLPAEAHEAAATYSRLRESARRISDRLEWPAEDFDAEVPALGIDPLPDPAAEDSSYRLVSLIAPVARSRLLQLAAWAGSHHEAFEIEAHLKATAEATAAAAERPRAGFR